MNNNKQIDIPAITREKRIMLRAKRYADGKLSLDEFVNLERLDEAIEELESEQLNEKTKQQAEKLQDMYKEEQAITEAKAEKPKAGRIKKLNLTIKEYDALSLYEQQQLYNEYPDEVEDLVKKARKSRAGGLL